MANEINRVGAVINISDIDSDWLWSYTFPDYPEIKIQSIQFNPGAVDDHCVIKNGSDTGPPFFDVTGEDADYDQRNKPYHGAKLMPVLDFSDGTYSAGSSVQIIVFL